MLNHLLISMLLSKPPSFLKSDSRYLSADISFPISFILSAFLCGLIVSVVANKSNPFSLRTLNVSFRRKLWQISHLSPPSLSFSFPFTASNHRHGSWSPSSSGTPSFSASFLASPSLLLYSANGRMFGL